MSTNDRNHDHDDTLLDASLRLQLRALRRDLEPAADLWPGIAARIAAEPRVATPAAAAPGPRRRVAGFAPWALAASLVLAVGVAWKTQGPPPAAVPADAGTGAVAMLPLQADAMTREYQAALRELEATAPARPGPRPDLPVLRELDESAAQIRSALDRAPDARFLLDRLRKTYALRLQLTQRADMT